MKLRLAVILPVLNEELRIRQAIESAFAAGADRVIVSDGGSTDQTRALAARAGAEVITGSEVRGVQANAGAIAAADCEIFCFLHGDSTLPEDAGEAMRAAVHERHRSGGFLLAFEEPDLRLRLGEALINLRTRITRLPWGDQAQFYQSDAFWKLEGFRHIPIMEDYDLAVRARRAGRPAILRLRVTTSGRRFIERGVLRTVWGNWKTILRYHTGTPPQALADEYRKSQRD